MNIIIINHYAGSTEMGMEFRPYYLAQEWIKLGHKVDIIAGDYSHLRKKNPDIEYDFQKENIDGIIYHWLKTGYYNGNGVKRALTMLRFVSKLWLNARKIVTEMQPDVVISSSTYPIDTFAAQRIARKAKAKLIHEVHDMWPATLTEVGGMSKWNPFVIAMQIGENSAYKRSDYVVSLPPCAKEYMMQHGMKAEKFVHITNGIVEEDWKNPIQIPTEHRAVLEKYRAEGKFVIGYVGGHALSNALDVFVDAAYTIEKDRNVQFVLIGNGVEKERLQERVRQMNLDNVCFLPPVPKLSVPNVMKYFDCAYIGAKKSPLYRFGIAANKLYDYMMAGKPIIYAIDAPNDYVKMYNCGISVDAGDSDALAEGIRCMQDMPSEKRIELGNNGKVEVENRYTFCHLAEQFAELFS